ncbi:unnamed protein product [Camellia sinensis]
MNLCAFCQCLDVCICNALICTNENQQPNQKRDLRNRGTERALKSKSKSPRCHSEINHGAEVDFEGFDWFF